MNRKKVYVTREIPGRAIHMLREHFDVEVSPYDRALTREEFLEGIKDAHGVLCHLTDAVDREAISKATNVKVFANYAVGFNNMDIKAAKELGVVLTNTPDVLTDTTAEIAWSLLFAASRRVVEADTYTRDGKFKAWAPTMFLGRDISGKTLGIIGAGRIGRAFARMSKGFNMNILYYNRSRNKQFEEELGAKYVDLDTLLKESDFISLHVPLTEDTKHLIGEREFKLMKNTAILINTARGPVVHEEALVKALREKEIWAAGLDVYENEPKLQEGLSELDNVVLTPHIGSATMETRSKMGEMAASNIISVLNGKGPINEVK